MCEDVLGVVMVMGRRLEVEMQMWGVQEAGGCPLKAARRKILKPHGSVHWAHAGALRVNVIVVEAVFLVQDARACALKAAHRNAACVV